MPSPSGDNVGNTSPKSLDVLFFGTFDEGLHPRTRILREGLEANSHPVSVINRPLGLSTAEKVRIARFPVLAVLLAFKLLIRWAQLLADSRGATPNVVIVGYMGHFDVHLARLRFRSSFLILDHLTGLAETARDRRVDRGARGRLLGLVDRSALARADLVLCDTDEQAAQIAGQASEVMVVPVGAATEWHDARRSATTPTGPMKVVFVGLFTPLQGTDVIARAAVEALRSAELEFTFVGTGQDLDVAKSVVGPGTAGVSWRDWVPAADLPELVAEFDVSLGIFGTTPKALRVVPNKVYQGLAAGTVVITSDTAPQRRLKEQHRLNRLHLTPPGDWGALARVLNEFARSTDQLRDRDTTDSDEATAPAAVVAPLAARLRA